MLKEVLSHQNYALRHELQRLYKKYDKDLECPTQGKDEPHG